MEQVTKLDAYDAVELALDRNERAFEAVKVMLDADLWPDSPEAFHKVIDRQVEASRQAREKLELLRS